MNSSKTFDAESVGAMLVLVGETSNGTGDIANPSHLSLVLSSNDTRLTLDSEIRSFSGNLVVDSQSSVSWRMSVEDRQPLRVVCHFPDSSVFELSPQEPKTIYINNPGGEEWDVKD